MATETAALMAARRRWKFISSPNRCAAPARGRGPTPRGGRGAGSTVSLWLTVRGAYPQPGDGLPVTGFGAPGDPPPPAGALDALVSDVVRENPSQVNLYRSGKTQTFGWFVGQIMKRTGGRADPATVREALSRALE